MEVLFIVIGILLLFVGSIIRALEDYALIDILVTIIGTTFLIFGIIKAEIRDTPKAIDVYRGKTTLEITYRDSIPVDSVVVFKK